MARPLKEGLDYFPMDCVIDEKLEALEAEYGMEGFGIYVKVLQSIYRLSSGELPLENKQTFSAWKTLVKRTNIPLDQLKPKILFMLDLELFDKSLYQKLGILTSSGIKKRIDAISKHRREDRKRLSKINRRNYPHGKPCDNPAITGESKVKESKVKNTPFDFELLWNKYPSKVGKNKAASLFKSTVTTEKDFSDIQTALENYIKSERVAKGFVQNGSTWFHNWRDWVVSPIQNVKSGIMEGF